MYRFLAAAALAFLAAWATPACRAGDTAAAGTALYLHGVLGSGAPLQGSRGDGTQVAGQVAACVNCHQRSGLGGREGKSLIPPIAGRYLFHPRAARAEDLDLPYVEGIRADREPYTEATLARAIREGVNSEGKPLGYLMPRFALGDADMAALIGHLKGLDQRHVPGVGEAVLHFATIVTPDADPVKTRGMLAVLEQFFADKNAFTRGPSPRLLSTHVMMFKANRRWQLHEWRLTGAPQTWREQLRKHLAAEPVLAVISGMGGKTWAPVHAFCEEAALPCLFPNVEAPPATADHDFYSLYFTRGVGLEAGLIAGDLGAAGPPPRRVRQIYRAGDSGQEGAAALARALGARGVAVDARALAADGAGLAAALGHLGRDEALVLWLRPDDLAALDGVAPPPGPVYLSGLLAGLDAAPLPAAWRERVHLAYPFALPDERLINVDFARGWFRIRQIPELDLQTQVDTYLACGVLSETVNHMADSFIRDYLVERIQGMLEHRIVTGYYPRLSLGTGQRFASKGGYLVHFAAGKGVVPDGKWAVP